MSSHPHSAWFVLAGGRAARMGGQDKGLITLDNKPLIQHVLERLRPQLPAAQPLRINANRNLEHYRQYGEVFSDLQADYPGPLGGMYAAMCQYQFDWYGFVPCDCPLLPLDLVRRMETAATADIDIVVAHDGRYRHPVITLLNGRVRPRIEAQLSQGDHKIALLYRHCRLQLVDFSDQPEAFINLNTLAELDQFGKVP